MLEVHPLHHSPNSWRDFFVHIATIVIGLLIAVGLEQTIEFFHHRHEVAETREALRSEREANRRMFAEATERFHLETIRFQNDLRTYLYLQQHPGAPVDAWPAKIDYHNFIMSTTSAAWSAAQLGNVLPLLPAAEVRELEALYKQLAVVEASYRDRLWAIRDARRYMTRDGDPSHLAPAQLAEQAVLAENVLAHQFRLGGDMRNLAAVYPDFNPAPKTEELLRIVHEVGETAIDVNRPEPASEPIPDSGRLNGMH